MIEGQKDKAQADATATGAKVDTSKLPSGILSESDRAYALADDLDRRYMDTSKKSDAFGREMNRIHAENATGKGNALRVKAEEAEEEAARTLRKAGIRKK